MTWLQYEVMEVDPEAYAEWEATVPAEGEGKGPAPEPEAAMKTVEITGEARLALSPVGGSLTSLVLGTGGVTKVEVLAEDPTAEKATTKKSSS